MTRKTDAEFDLIVVGATGFTGALVARWLTENSPTSLKWALAGRSQEKLEACRSCLSELNGDRVTPDIVVVDTSDKSQCSHLVQRTKVIVTTVGPYSLLGENLLAACAKFGTHYCDLTGEVKHRG